uniref:Uncharacterized protein n=1 Tax=Romanomermis culicivorax TaxID=13658 RepID=A0A915K9Y3_ROMCU
MHSFKSREECIKAMQTVDELKRKYVRYELRQGHCSPTMNLTKPDLHMTKTDCMYTPIRKTMWYVVPEMGYCKFEENVTTRLLKSEYRAWFKTLQECSQYLDGDTFFIQVSMGFSNHLPYFRPKKESQILYGEAHEGWQV